MDQKKLINDLENKVREMGAGAPMRMVTIATSAMAENEDAKNEIERVIGRPVDSWLDYWNVMTACTNLMSKGEINALETDAIVALKGQRNSATDADAYLANRLGSLRRNAGLTQQQLSQKSGVPLTTLQKLENGTNRILGCRTEIALKLSNALGITIEELVSTAQ